MALALMRATVNEHLSHPIAMDDAHATAPSDVIFTFAFTAWSVAAERGFAFSEDRLAIALIGHPRTRLVLICDPLRSAPRKLVRSLLHRSRTSFPTRDTASHYAPLRLRRHDQTSPVQLECEYAAYERRIRNVALRRGLERPAIITGNPLLAGYGDFSWAGPVTYYGWDDWTAYEPRRRWWPAFEDAFARLRGANRRVVAVTDNILRVIASTGECAVVPNGIDLGEWETLPRPPHQFADLPSPRLLYLGSLDSRIDVRQLRAVSEAFPGASITLFGPLLDPQHLAQLQDCHNVRIKGRVGRRDVAGIIAGADVGLIPHVRSALTEAMSPLKLYEYLAGGLPVAAVDLPGIAGVSDRVSLVPPGDDLVPAVRRALARGRASEAQRRAFVSENSWDHRFDRLLDVALAPAASAA